MRTSRHTTQETNNPRHIFVEFNNPTPKEKKKALSNSMGFLILGIFPLAFNLLVFIAVADKFDPYAHPFSAIILSLMICVAVASYVIYKRTLSKYNDEVAERFREGLEKERIYTQASTSQTHSLIANNIQKQNLSTNK